ncbi:GspH/FimT family pseudopilin [Delftia lacustris]|uniref:GspH/FimT family pseudopilin n=1 Tax=Delftia lacustris TaxID=558537 RepID=UPI0035A60148
MQPTWAHLRLRQAKGKPLPDMLVTPTAGFTTIELIVVVAILAVLASLAAPSFMPIIERWRVRQTIEGLQSTLYYARSEAIKRGGKVVLQKNPNNTNGCTTAGGKGDWNCGWFVCEDTNGNGSCDGTEPVLQHFDTQAGIQVKTCGTPAVGFNRWGLLEDSHGFNTDLRFAITPLGKNRSHPAVRGVYMSRYGQVAMSHQPKTCPN